MKKVQKMLVFCSVILWSLIISAQAPDPVISLTSSNITETSLDLNWSVPAGTITEYRIYQDENPLEIGTSVINSYNVMGLTADTNYSFMVRAFNETEGSLDGFILNISTDITPPNTVDDLTSSDITFSSATLNWSPADDNVATTDYQIFQDDVLIGTSDGFSTYNVESLSELTIYRFHVKALDAAGNISELSNVEIVETPKETSEVNYTSFNANLISVDWAAKDIFAFGNVGVGTLPNSNYKLAVAGNVVAEEVRVALQANWPDYVFKSDYDLPSLKEVESFILKHGHLENIPSAALAEKEGISLGEMNALLLRKIEELTLYIIEQDKKIAELSSENQDLEKINNRLLELEKLFNEIKEKQ